MKKEGMQVQCDNCQGLGFVEYQHGLIRLTCRRCGVTDERIIERDQPDNTIARIEDTGESISKRKTRGRPVKKS